MEGDFLRCSDWHVSQIFLPTPSHGGRLELGDVYYWGYGDFYPRPHMEGDCSSCAQSLPVFDFYPRPHMEGDLIFTTPKIQGKTFLPTPSHGGRPVGL